MTVRAELRRSTPRAFHSLCDGVIRLAMKELPSSIRDAVSTTILPPHRGYATPEAPSVSAIGPQSLESRLNESQVHHLAYVDLRFDQTFLEIPLLVVLNFFEIHLAVGREFRSIQADSQQFFISGAGIFSDDIDDAIKGFFLFEYRVVE